MTSPFLLARKPLGEEEEETPKKPSAYWQALQPTDPGPTESRQKWQIATTDRNNTLQQREQQDIISPIAATIPETSYTDRFQPILAIGEASRVGQEASSEQQRQRAAAIAARKLYEQQQAAMNAAYAASAKEKLGALTGSQTIPGGGGGGIGGTTYNGNVVWDRSDAAVADLLRKAGVAEKDIGMGLAIAFAESSFRENARHPNTTGRYAGTIDQGLWQINTMHKGEAWYPKNVDDPWESTLAAVALYKRAGNRWTDWTTYNAGLTPRAVPATRLTPTVTAMPATSGGVFATSNGTLRNQVVQKSLVVLNLPYVWGGNSLTTGVDCSGLVQQVYKQVLGMNVPRQARAQAVNGAIGTRVAGVNQLQPGDLVAFQWAGGYAGAGTVSHIAIYAGNNQIIEAYGGNAGRRRSLGNSQQDRGAIYIHVRFPNE